MNSTPLRFGVIGNKDDLARIEPSLLAALQDYMPPRLIDITAHDPFPPGGKNDEVCSLLKGGKNLASIESIAHRAGTLAQFMLERTREIDCALRIDSGNLRMILPKPVGGFYDGQYGVVAMLAVRLKGVGAVMLYSSAHTQGFLNQSGVGHRQEADMSKTAILGVLPRWWSEMQRGAHLIRNAEAA